MFYKRKKNMIIDCKINYYDLTTYAKNDAYKF